MNFTIIVNIALAFALAYTFFVLSMLRHPAAKRNDRHDMPLVTVLVPFRNEAAHVALCIDALKKQTYPQEKYSVIFLDDHSDDGSTAIVEDSIKEQSNMSLFQVDDSKGNLKAKMNVLAQGMQLVSTPFVFVTDADCQPNPEWIVTLLRFFDDNTGAVSGFTQARSLKEKPGFFEKMQINDWFFLQSFAVGSANAGRPITLVGNNMVLRKAVYDKIGGFENMDFSVTEDLALTQAILSKTEYTVRHICEKPTVVYTLPVKAKHFITQRRRWIHGGLKAGLREILLGIMIIISHLMIVVIFALKLYTKTAALAIGLTLGIDYFIFRRTLDALGESRRGKRFIFYEIYLILNFIFFSILSLFPFAVQWKDRKY